MRLPQRARGFTLVELLVVIGIIALLISILLPALNAARRQAAQTKCAAHMKQTYAAYLLYANENKGFWPVCRIQTGQNTSSTTLDAYDLYDATFHTNSSVYWYDLLSKYLTKTKLGVLSGTGDEAESARRSIIWGCPAFDGYITGAAMGGINRNQTGVGMNQWPTFKGDTSPLDPTTGLPSSATTDVPLSKSCVQANIFNYGKPGSEFGRFHKAVEWGREGARRMLLSDSRLYFAESRTAPADRTFPAQPVPYSSVLWTTGISTQTMVDVYRHGKSPGPGAVANTLAATGGKVAYNILYCDGHVTAENTQQAAYESVRMRYPG